MAKITSFHGKYEFLSNFFPVVVEFEGMKYPSAEHAYVAAKTIDLNLRKKISKIDGAGKVKRYGRKMELRPDWNSVKIEVMTRILESKFSDKRLEKMLSDTKPHELVEGNTWNDTFWGECPIGEGHNYLGKILMEIRDANKLTKFFV